MTEIDVDKDEAFKAIKDSILPEFEDPTEEQQEAIDKLDRQTGFNPDPVPLVEAATTEIMDKYSLVRWISLRPLKIRSPQLYRNELSIARSLSVTVI